jgi:hypothetical protein
VLSPKACRTAKDGESYVESEGISARDQAKALRAAAAEMTESIARNRFRLAGIGLVGMPPRSLVDSLSDLEQYVFGMQARAAQLEEEARGQLL